MSIDADLAQQLVNDSEREKGSLPLLQYALDKLWKAARQQGCRHLSATLYASLGVAQDSGLRGLLNKKADDFYHSLEPNQQTLLQWLLVELTQSGENQDDTRKTLPRDYFYTHQPTHTDAIDTLLHQLIDQERLLTADKDKADKPTVTIAHEALLRDWLLLVGWLKDNAALKKWRAGIAAELAAWQAGWADNVLRGARLTAAETILENNPDSLLIGARERDFIAASIKQHETETRRRRVRVRQAFAALLVGLVIGQLALNKHPCIAQDFCWSPSHDNRRIIILCNCCRNAQDRQRPAGRYLLRVA